MTSAMKAGNTGFLKVLLAVVVEEIFNPHQRVAALRGDSEVFVFELHLRDMHADWIA